MNQSAGSLSPDLPLPKFASLGQQPDFGDFDAEYYALRSGVAVVNLSAAGKLEVSGDNAVQFLNGLVTNEVKSLTPGSGTLAAFLNVHGKVLALTRIYRTATHFLLELESINRQKIFQNLSRFVPAGGFFVKDVSESLALISIQGTRASSFISDLLGIELGTAPFANIECEFESSRILVTSHPRCSLSGFDLFAPWEAADSVWNAILTRDPSSGIRAVGMRAFEVARIESGIPKEPEDITESNILLETGLEQAVSYTKGCYLGQEIIARIHWRGQPAKRLMGLNVDSDRVPLRGTELYAEDGKKVGEITSSALSPKLEMIIALAYVHRYYLTIGTSLELKHDGNPVGAAKVAALPFSNIDQA